jgi:hypothetical protein
VTGLRDISKKKCYSIPLEIKKLRVFSFTSFDAFSE